MHAGSWAPMVGVAQLVRAPDCGSGGRRFDPGRSPSKALPRNEFRHAENALECFSEKVDPEVLTPLGGVSIVYARSELVRHCQRCVLLEMEFPTCRSCGVKNTPKEQPKLIENSGFECIERAYFDRHYVLSSPTFGSGRSNNIDSERSI